CCNSWWGILDLVDDGVNGILFEEGNVAELGETINLLLDRSDLIDSYSVKSCEKIRKQFSGERAARQVVDIYTKLL
ncbi:unnamed protein product, partial [marine sediment metagenome]